MSPRRKNHTKKFRARSSDKPEISADKTEKSENEYVADGLNNKSKRGAHWLV